MSSRTSAAVLLELPGRTWADRVSDALGWLAAVTVAWVVSRYAQTAVAAILGLAVAVAFAIVRERTRQAGPVELLPDAATRRLGPSLVVAGRWTGSGPSLAPTWLTPLDLPADRLRRLSLLLRAAHRKAGS